MQPLCFEPILKQKIWGGRRLQALLGKHLPTRAGVGESWELSDHPSAQSRVAEGPAKGLTLRRLIETDAEPILGPDAPQAWHRRFPLLIKFIDADDRLSIQVHPDDAFAAEHEAGESGKTECWWVMHADPEAWVIRGLRSGVSREELSRALADGNVEDKLNRLRVATGDFIFIPAGTVHAVGPGILLAEIQQTSDVTYRLWDWGRVGPDGKERPLHIDHALESIHYGEQSRGGTHSSASPQAGPSELCRCHAFAVTKVEMQKGSWHGHTAGSFVIIVTIRGHGSLQTAEGEAVPLGAGDTLLVPADAGAFDLKTDDGLTALVASAATQRNQVVRKTKDDAVGSSP